MSTPLILDWKNTPLKEMVNAIWSHFPDNVYVPGAGALNHLRSIGFCGIQLLEARSHTSVFLIIETGEVFVSTYDFATIFYDSIKDYRSEKPADSLLVGIFKELIGLKKKKKFQIKN